MTSAMIQQTTEYNPQRTPPRRPGTGKFTQSGEPERAPAISPSAPLVLSKLSSPAASAATMPKSVKEIYRMSALNRRRNKQSARGAKKRKPVNKPPAVAAPPFANVGSGVVDGSDAGTEAFLRDIGWLKANDSAAAMRQGATTAGRDGERAKNGGGRRRGGGKGSKRQSQQQRQQQLKLPPGQSFDYAKHSKFYVGGESAGQARSKVDSYTAQGDKKNSKGRGKGRNRSRRTRTTKR